MSRNLLKQDLFNLHNKDSLIRQLLREKKEINLKEYKHLPIYEHREDYESIDLKISDEKFRKEIIDKVTPFAEESTNHGYPEIAILTSLNEAVLNAYQHGNKKDSSKPITLEHKLGENKARYAIIDQGGLMNPEAVAYIILNNSEHDSKNRKFLSFYKFAEEEVPPDNYGMGIWNMHTYMDLIKFYKSEKGGLVLHMTKLKEGKKPEEVDNLSQT